MKSRLAIVVLLVLSMLSIHNVSASVAGIPNPSFEDDSGWVFSHTGDNWYGVYTADWGVTEGVRSYEIYIQGDNEIAYLPGANTYGQISEQVDLTGVKEVKFDLRTSGAWDAPDMGAEYFVSFEVLVDDAVVYSIERQVGVFLNQIAPVAGYDGSHTLTLRMRNHADFSTDVDNGRIVLIDNLRLVTTKAFLPSVFKPSTCTGVPTLISPTNESQLNTLIPEFRWNDGKFPGATTLILEVSSTIDFVDHDAKLWTGAQGGQDVGFRFSTNLAPATKYYWRAQLMCGEETGAFTEIRTFTTGSGGVIPASPVLSLPVNGSTLPGTSVTLSWQPVNGATHYNVLRRIVDTYGWYLWEVTDTQITLNNMTGSTTYEWFVEARNDYAISERSNYWQFTTGPGSNLTSTDCSGAYVQGEDGTITSCELGQIITSPSLFMNQE